MEGPKETGHWQKIKNKGYKRQGKVEFRQRSGVTKLRTEITFTTLHKLQAREDEAVLIVKLMMAFNDLALANECLSHFKPGFEKNRDNKERGAALYFVRLGFSHLFGAMTIIDAIARHPSLREKINRCSENGKTAFNRLISLRQNKEEQEKFEQVIGRLRSHIPLRATRIAHQESNSQTSKKQAREPNLHHTTHQQLILAFHHRRRCHGQHRLQRNMEDPRNRRPQNRSR